MLSAPVNGRLENVACGNVYGSVCRLVCYKGYELRGSVERKCDKIAGTNVVQWTGNTTSCLSKLPRLCLVAGNAKPCSTIKRICMEHTLWCYSFDATVGFWTISALFTSCFAKLRKKAQKIVCLLLTHFSPTFPQCIPFLPMAWLSGEIPMPQLLNPLLPCKNRLYV